MTRTAFRGGMRGITLLELMLGVAVAGIILAFAVPSFETSIRNSRLRGTTMELVRAINTARAQAINHRKSVTLRPFDNADWNSGIVVDYPDGAAGIPEEDLETRLPQGVSIQATAASTVFDSSGIASTQIVFSICDNRADETGRQVTLQRLGRVDTQELSPCF